MYLERAIYENVGPLEKVDVVFSFEPNGNPKPVIFVGENGCGKSTLLSNIVDAFYETASAAFNDARHTLSNYSQQYYKAISFVQIKTGRQYMYSYLSFSGASPFSYLYKSGNLSVDDFKQKTGITDSNMQWDREENFKNTLIDKPTAEKIWQTNVICYFGPDRYERPVWLGGKYFEEDEYMHPGLNERVAGHLDKPISVKNVTKANLRWLMDVIADSRPDVRNTPNGFEMEHVNPQALELLGRARQNLEVILSNIIGDDVFFTLNPRNSNDRRFMILRKRDNLIISPTLDSLSSGQIALFNMFSTIVRYADMNDIGKSINLSDIEGIVVIDEIELHLHSKLQKEVLPKLLKLFPKVQFIITTHAPLFLLGMRDCYGEEHFDVYELPSATKISTEKFSEFKRAYDYLKETETYQKEAEEALRSVRSNGRPIIITEGSTDWKHLKAAYQSLSKNVKYKGLFDNLDIDFLEYEPANSHEECSCKLEMGNNILCNMCETAAKLLNTVKYIFIADRDHNDTNNKMSKPGASYKFWGNNVYSFILPIPEHRKKTPGISIEHYYTDTEIKTEWVDTQSGGTVRRLYIGNEFDERGVAYQMNRACENKKKCGKNSIAIIDGSSGEKVTCLSQDDGTNYALPKAIFAKMVLEKQPPFDKMNFDSFVKVFETIKEIINDKGSSNA